MTCELVEGPHVAPGWGCCKCKSDPLLQGMSVYNGAAREECKRCGHKFCGFPATTGRIVNGPRPAPHLVERDGEILAVLRPADPELSRKLVEKAQRSKDPNAFHRVLSNPKQSFTFVGLLRSDGKIVHSVTHEVVDEIRPWDSFVHQSSLQNFEKVEP